MKISERFDLQKTQHELDSVDINPDEDIRLFLDAHFLGLRTDAFSTDATRTIQSFFAQFLNLYRAGDIEGARLLFEYLGEPNETCLGLSSGSPKGRGVGRQNAQDIFDSITASRAVQTGLVEHLEDFRIFVKGVDKDKISDMTTNIIRHHLIQYTQAQCRLWLIPMQSGVPTGFFWDRAARRWDSTHADMLLIDDAPILLVPKDVVSYARQYAPSQYQRHFVLNFLRNEHLRLNTALVQRKTLKDGSVKEWVTKKSVQEHEAPPDKDYLATSQQTIPLSFAISAEPPLAAHSHSLMRNSRRTRTFEGLLNTCKTACGTCQPAIGTRQPTTALLLEYSSWFSIRN
jgi:hypothetical protein